jgi:hypothetical protein
MRKSGVACMNIKPENKSCKFSVKNILQKRISTFQLIVLTCFLLLFASCLSGPEKAASSKDGSENKAAQARSGLEGIKKGKVALPTVTFPEKAITSRLKKEYGSPLRLDENKKQNTQAADYKDSVFSFVYKDITYTVFRSGYNGDESLLSAKITGKNIELDNKLKLGLERKKVYDILGFPSIEDDISMIYYLPSPNGKLTYEYYVSLENNIVSEIQISGYGT